MAYLSIKLRDIMYIYIYIRIFSNANVNSLVICRGHFCEANLNNGDLSMVEGPTVTAYPVAEYKKAH